MLFVLFWGFLGVVGKTFNELKHSLVAELYNKTLFKSDLSHVGKPNLISAIPALQPIVHDLFVLRGTNKADAGKELETQKEVVVSMLLRLIQYHQVREENGPVYGL